MVVSLIAAMASNRVIGVDNDLPWHLPDDMKFFQSKTRGHIVVMGRKNYDSLPPKYKPLPNRTNVILTRQHDFKAPECIIFHDLEKAIDYARSSGEQELFIIGGGEIYTQAMDRANRIYLTEIHAEFPGDTFFPELTEQWKEVERTAHPVDDRHSAAFDFVVYEKSIT